MLPRNAWNLYLMSDTEFINRYKLGRVTTAQIFEPSTSILHPEGLYSETIFGEVGSDERYTRCGFINFGVRLLKPSVFKDIVSLKGSYDDIIGARSYAIFNTKTKDFEIVDPETPGAKTGIDFFMTHMNDIDFGTSNSDTRNVKVQYLKKYADRLHCDTAIVIPAGLRDVIMDGDTPKVEDINKIYGSLISMSNSIPEGAKDNPVFNFIKYRIQTKLLELYDAIFLLVSGKRGFVQGHFASRHIALSSRNTITPATCKCRNPKDPQYIKSDETGVPLFQALATCRPLIYHYVQRLFIRIIFEVGAPNSPLIDPKTFKLEYYPVTEEEKQTWITPDGIDGLINRFKYSDFRHRPAAIKDSDNKWRYLMLVYDLGDTIFLFRNIDDLKFGRIFIDVLPDVDTFGDFNRFVTTDDKEIPMTIDLLIADDQLDLYKKETKYKSGEFNAQHVMKVKSITPIASPNKYLFYEQLTNEEVKKIDASKTYSVVTFSILTDTATQSEIDMTKVRPLTYGELFYICAYEATLGKYCFVTRYPVLHQDNIYASKVHLLSTDPARIVKLKSLNDEISVDFPRYPNIGITFTESTMIHMAYESGALLNADHDGDMVNLTIMWSEDATKECAEYMQSPGSVIRPNGNLHLDFKTDLVNLVLFNLSKCQDVAIFEKAYAQAE